MKKNSFFMSFLKVQMYLYIEKQKTYNYET